MLDTLISGLSPQSWPFNWELLPQPIYLVGGAVRDGLLGYHSPSFDLDFIVLSGAVKVARKLATDYQGGFVLLDAERQIARVVFPQGTVDFAQAEGGQLEIDLMRRDFRMNAIAYNPFTQDIIDPLGGVQDLEKKLIRLISKENLREDPLRLLRAYRQRVKLGFTIESETLKTLQELAPLLQQVSPERIRTELGYLLTYPQGISTLCQAWKDGLLSPFFPQAYQQFPPLNHLEFATEILTEKWPILAKELQQFIKDTIKTPLSALARLALFVSQNPQKAHQELHQLKYSNREIKTVISLINTLAKLQENSPLSLREEYFLFQEIGSNFSALVLLGIAHQISLEKIIPLIERYLDPQDQIAHPTPLINGNELMAQLNLTPSAKIGEILLEIQLARIEGKITNPTEAFEWVTQWLYPSL